MASSKGAGAPASIAEGLNGIVQAISAAKFGPLNVWDWQQRGLMNYAGTLVGDPDAPAGGGPE